MRIREFLLVFLWDILERNRWKGGEKMKEVKGLIYSVCKSVYDGVRSPEEGVAYLVKHAGNFGETSHKLAILVFENMMKGEKYTCKVHTELVLYFISQIGTDYGKEAMYQALKATYENIRYCYEQTGEPLQELCEQCEQLYEQVKDEKEDKISFGDDIFKDIIPKTQKGMGNAENRRNVRYWLYSAGENSKNWEEDYRQGIMAIGWDKLGDLSQFSSKEEMRQKMKTIYGQGFSYRNQVHATWQFAKEIQIGDIVFVKRGRTKIIGKGIVSGEYEYKSEKKDYKNVRSVQWIEKGEREAPVKSASKILTDITPYTEYVHSLEFLFLDEVMQRETEGIEGFGEYELEKEYETYTENDFLSEVYISAKEYRILKQLLLRKKNLILEGAPGVGKTYCASRLAYSMMGEKNEDRIRLVQFHQSYSYEDFIMGFRPTEQGFQLKKGVFYDFCKKAEMDSENPYFFLIDEINRGNLSKIFGELFLLIEQDKRGQKAQLLYSDELFFVPPNLYIIGMMNTADRSLAMLDYALRRRFAFYEFEPAFESEGFIEYQKRIGNKKFDRLIKTVESLNRAIVEDEMLGKGFQIGHSYFCTDSFITEEWLKSTVEFELIPLLQEYWFDEPSKIKEWSHLLREAIT